MSTSSADRGTERHPSALPLPPPRRPRRTPRHRALSRTEPRPCALDGSLPRFELTAAELTELGHQLYELLAQFHGYVAAKVGWDPEPFLDPAELGEWTDELNDGSLHGLVLSEKLYAELDLSTEYEVFRPGYRWMPYRGEGPSNLTID